MEFKKITKEHLKKSLDSGENILLIDVLPPEYYKEKHIKGAQNAPVYEVKFLEYIEKLTTEKNQRIVVYSEDPESFAAQDSAEKLMKAGYQNVEIFSDGLKSWESEGWEMEKGEPLTFSEPHEGRHDIDVEKSVFNWTGRNAKYAHHGKINLKSGYIDWEDGKVTGGQFYLDMTTIKDEDLQDETMKEILESHLRSTDFFNVEEFPEAIFVIEQVRDIQEKKGQANCEISGNLTIKDVSRNIEFPAMIVAMEDGSINGQAHFDIDRTLWNVRYGSERFFEKLGMHLVNDNISLEIFLIARA